MKWNYLYTFCFITLILISSSSCIGLQDKFRSRELISSKGEKLYINTLNWGMTGDKQYTVITKDRTRLKERKDTIGGIGGLSPFVYKFANDTLTIYHKKGFEVYVDEVFESIHLHYVSLDNRNFMDIVHKAIQGVGGYQQLP